MPWGRHLGGTQAGPARGVPISHNVLQHYPEFHGADTCVGGAQPVPAGKGGTLPGQDMGGYPVGGTQVGYPCQVRTRGYPGRVPPAGYPSPGQVRTGGGYPVRTTEGVLTTQRAVCLLRSRRRTFLFHTSFLLNEKRLCVIAKKPWPARLSGKAY